MICLGLLFVFSCPDQDIKPPVLICPPVIEWSRQYQARLADEIGRMPDDSAVSRAMREHLQMRDRARKCRKRTAASG